MSVSTDHFGVAAGDHLVHFYDDAHDLSRIVGPYLAAALGADANTIVIATGEHRDAFASALGSLGVDVRRAEEQGRLVSLDAPDYLERLLVGGNVDPVAFEQVVGDIVRRAAGDGRPVRVYGSSSIFSGIAGTWRRPSTSSSGGTS